MLIRNYKPALLESMMRGSGLQIQKRKSISWLRKTPLENLPPVLTDSFERIMQFVSGVFLLGPSNWYVLEKPANAKKTTAFKTFESSLVDPKTKQTLTKKKLVASQSTTNKADFYDLRYPRPRD